MNELPTLKTVGDVLGLIEANVNSSNEKLSAHAKTLLGPRTRGSTTKIGLESLDPNTEVYQRVHECVKSPCVAYRFLAKEMGGKVLAVPLLEALVASDGVITRDGEHGLELVAVNPHQDLFATADHNAIQIWVIIGEFEGEPAVFTWHPGQPLVPFDPSNMSAKTGVKLK